MSDTVWLALIATIPPTLAALAAWRASERSAARSDETVHKADTLIEKTAEIHTATNGGLQRVTSALGDATSKLEVMERLVATMAESKRVADEVAAKAAEKVPPASP